jgi:uncharacterized protein (DUF4415 family)
MAPMMCIIRRPEGVLRSRLRAQPESEIDYSDIPQLQEDFWKKAVRNPFYRPTKTSTTVRIDSDVLHWLRAHGKGYQSRLSAILRREMLASLKTTVAKHGGESRTRVQIPSGRPTK